MCPASLQLHHTTAAGQSDQSRLEESKEWRPEKREESRRREHCTERKRDSDTGFSVGQRLTCRLLAVCVCVSSAVVVVVVEPPTDRATDKALPNKRSLCLCEQQVNALATLANLHSSAAPTSTTATATAHTHCTHNRKRSWNKGAGGDRARASERTRGL